ncbi:thioredoxin [Burkholderia sp. AU45388]|uniref:thioredoxin n=1 Tax=Burkholderia sp. AU45388 TaxID=3059206 RepID=UPI002650875B|nr:thioredoxin [Burkholderia sp. AU45388]MDN7424983.1 thioredoxin [Burkholderia sp. AU45388]
MSNLKAVTLETIEADVINNPLPVLVDFWAPWCGPCKALAPTLSKLSEQFQDNVAFVKIDVDENAGVRERFGVRGIPTLILLRGGKELGRVVGNRSATQLAGFIDNHLGSVTPLPTVIAVVPNAFGGNAQLKAERLAALGAWLDRKRAAPSEAMWDGEIGSAIQFVCNTADVDDCARTLGIPANVLAVVESLSSYRSTHLNGAEFVAHWLDAVPVGANLSRLPQMLVTDLLSGGEMTELIGGDPTLLSIRDRLTAQHDPARAEGPLAPELAAIRQALAKSDTAAAGAAHALATRLLVLTAQPLGDAAIVTDFIFGLAGAHWELLRAACNWTSDDDRRFMQLADETSKRAVERGEEASHGEKTLERIELVDSSLIARFRSHYGDGTRAMKKVGMSIGDRLIAITKRCT